MAEELDYAEFGLPSEFFTEDFFMEEKGTGGGGGAALFPSEFPYEWGWYSEVNSPGDSAAGTDASEEEDYLAGLTWQMAHYFLRDDEKKPASNTAIAAAAPKGTLMVGSPQSILCAVGSWNDEFGKRQRTGRRGPCAHRRGRNPFLCFLPFSPRAPPTAIAQARRSCRSSLVFPSAEESAARRHMAAARDARPRRPAGAASGLVAHRRRLPAAARTGQSGGVTRRRPQAGVSCGTGVFLPRQLGRPSDLRKKQVLLPARVVQALNLDVKVPPPLIDHGERNEGGLSAQSYSTLSRSSAVMPQGRGFSPPAKTGTERFLPADWTY
ncbi:unnamed protein product [Spirodela intermedia]|uniref:Uncharacterized protein n=1 Tax=Spirodela intermedia TaxID=51605 RepID=A0A7I8IX19_SPIIN|nr:unnamed protein product [Spirodela intermedia]CAA6661711.1 unnamed protein product [Spirodela intermedia]